MNSTMLVSDADLESFVTVNIKVTVCEELYPFYGIVNVD